MLRFREHSGIEAEQHMLGLNGQSMNNPERCFSVHTGRHCAVIFMCVCVRKRQRWGHGREGIHLSPKYYTVVKNICNARGYFEKYLKKFNSALTFCWAFVNRFTLHIIWLRVREDCCYCIMLLISKYVNLFSTFSLMSFYFKTFCFTPAWCFCFVSYIQTRYFKFWFEIICLIHKSNFTK